MPEGDTIFRTARALGRALVDQPVTVFRSTYPLLTRFDEDTPLVGQLVDKVEARGKWLLIHFSGGATLATHMLMNGSWHIYRPGERWQRPGGDMRIVLENSAYVAVGFTVPVAKMLKPHELDRALKAPLAGMPRSRTMIPLIAASAVDVLSDDFDPSEVERRILARRDEAIGDVLLNQSVFAGVGNVFKSEICFVTATNPFCPVSALEDRKISVLIATASKLMKANVLEESGNLIVTYGGRKRRTTHESDPGANLWVYGRAGEPCRNCGAPIQSSIQGRNVRITYWCPHCQPTCGGADARSSLA